jgi:hypothetical protein
MALTHSQFASFSAYLASRCAGWAGECAEALGYPMKPMNDDSVERFVAMLRETADHIEKRHFEKQEGNQ